MKQLTARDAQGRIRSGGVYYTEDELEGAKYLFKQFPRLKTVSVCDAYEVGPGLYSGRGTNIHWIDKHTLTVD